MSEQKRDTAVLSVRGLFASVAGQQVVEDASFTVADRGVTALLGRNGVGKTSTIKALLGIIDRTGEVTYRGSSIDKLPTHRVVQHGIGYVPEDREVFGSLTVEENLRLAILGDSGNRETVDRLFPELRQRAKQQAGTLSGGQQQMVALARVLMEQRGLLLVDEPTKGLAPRIVTEVTEALKVVAEETPVLLVEQNLQVVRDLAHSVIVLSGGRVVHTGDAQEFLDSDLVHRHLGVTAGKDDE